MEAGEVPATKPGGNSPASFSGVCPPRPTITPTTPGPEPRCAERASASSTASTSSVVRGSKYNRSLVS